MCTCSKQTSLLHMSTHTRSPGSEDFTFKCFTVDPICRKVQLGVQGTQCTVPMDQPEPVPRGTVVSHQGKVTEISLLFTRSCSYGLRNRSQLVSIWWSCRCFKIAYLEASACLATRKKIKPRGSDSILYFQSTEVPHLTLACHGLRLTYNLASCHQSDYLYLAFMLVSCCVYTAKGGGSGCNIR